MIVEISNTTLTRLVNYEAVTRKNYQEAQKLQWRVMTLDVMRECEKMCDRMRHVAQIAGYSLYLYKLQNGLSPRRSIYAEPAISRGLVELLEELNIPVRMVPEHQLAEVAFC
jgi:hypothetical protein